MRCWLIIARFVQCCSVFVDSARGPGSATSPRQDDYETVGILPLISRKTLGILTYSLEYGRLFCCYGFVNGFVNADTMWHFRVATDRYLARVCYLVAGQ